MGKILHKAISLLQSPKSRRVVLAWIFSAILIGEVLLPMIPTQWKALSLYCMVALTLLEIVPWAKMSSGLGNIDQRLIAVVVTSIIVLPIAYITWYPFNNYLYSLNQPRISAYVKPTTEIVSTFLGKSLYRNTLEFGALDADERIDIEIETQNLWVQGKTEAWFDNPGQKTPSGSASPIFNQEIPFGGISFGGIQPSINETIKRLTLKFDAIKVDNKKSIYLSFFSLDEPLKYKIVNFAGIRFELRGQQFIPIIK